MNSDNWRIKRDHAVTPQEQTRTPARSYQQRSDNNETLSSGSTSRNTSINSSFQEKSGDDLRQPIDEGKASKSIEEGRRVYVGNMPYEATMKDIESLFRDVSDGIEAINISIDPMTGRNPSYCFIDFTTKALSERVMEEYNGRIFMRRPLRVKPGVKSGTGKGKYNLPPQAEHAPNNLNRWNQLATPESVNTAAKDGRRLYVGGLPRFDNNEASEAAIRELFESIGVTPEIVSKLVWRDESKRWVKGNHNYCFVDCKSSKDAEIASAKLDGLEKWGWHLNVNFSTGISGKLRERKRLFVGGLPVFPTQKALDEEIGKLFEGYGIFSISKRFEPRAREGEEGGNHSFCFVELEDEVQTDKAIEELHSKEMWGSKVSVKMATKTGHMRPSENRLPAEGRKWR